MLILIHVQNLYRVIVLDMLGDQTLKFFHINNFQNKQRVRIILKSFILNHYVAVDNGDNDGNIIPEYFDSGGGSLDATRCIESWLGNMVSSFH